jgi:hypothetical protein
VASEPEVLGRIRSLVDEEHDLRECRERDEITADSERQRLRDVEVELDRCWDLLRQRRALRESGRNPDEARPRSDEQVEGYLG